MMLLLTAAMLGLLAFFEPCTIATHTLFSARIGQRRESPAFWSELFLTWAFRSLLLMTIFSLSVWWFEPPHWGPYTPSIMLAIIAAVYLISRFLFLPVPHLEFFRLLPFHHKLPYSARLGLTLPACTLPLVLVTGMAALGQDSILLALVAGLLFSTLFTLPMIITALGGLRGNDRKWLNTAATSSPWITALLLLGLALWLLAPQLDIDRHTLERTLSVAGWSGLGVAFLAGFVFSFNPVSFASIPVMLAYVTRAHEKRRALALGGAFVGGMIVTHVALGVSAALGGEWVKSVMGRQWALLLGPLLIFMGLVWSGLITPRLPWFGVRAAKVSSAGGAFLLGIPFSVAICPFCAPALMVSLTASASIGSAGYGAALLLAFALGRSIPIILGAWGMGWLESLKALSRFQRPLEVGGGVTLILSGVYLLNEYFFWFNF